MKKRKIKNVVIFTILLSLTVLLFSSQSIAGTNTKLTNSTKQADVKDTKKGQVEKKQKTDAKSTTDKKSTDVTSTKSSEVKKNNTTDDEKDKSSDKKKAVVKISTTKKVEDSKNKIPVEKKEIPSSNKTIIEKISNKTTDDSKRFNFDTQKKYISKSESITNTKSSTDKHNTSNPEMIINPLNKDTVTSGINHYVPRPTIDINEIEELDNIQIIIYNNIEYRWYYGYYYEPWWGCYIRIWPPFGFRIGWLPPYYYAFWYRDIEYYYCCNVYYIYVEEEEEYVVVRPPIGAVVETIPGYSEKLIVDGETYFIADAIQYKAVIVNDEIWFKVIKVIDEDEYDIVQIPVGALIETLPEDRELILIDDQTYYIADNVQYKAVIVNDEIWFKVLKVG